MAPDVDSVLVDLVRWLAIGDVPAARRLTDRTLERVQREADRHRLIGGLLAAVEQGWIDVTDEGVRSLERHVSDRARRCVSVETALLDTVSALGEAGLTPFVLKGVASAHLDYPDPMLRTFNDVDLLVRPGDIDAAIAALEGAGSRRDLPARSSSWDSRFAKDIPLVHPTGVEIDLHRSLAQGAFGLWIDPVWLVEEPSTFCLGGVDVAAGRPAARAFHAVIALTIGESDQRLAHVVDLVLASKRVEDPSEVLELCRRCRSVALYEEAMDRIVQVLGTPVTTANRDPFTRADEPASRSEGLARRAYRTARGSHTGELLTGFLALGGVRDRVDYGRALLAPSHDYRTARTKAGRVAEWRGGLRQLFGGESE